MYYKCEGYSIRNKYVNIASAFLTLYVQTYIKKICNLQIKMYAY